MKTLPRALLCAALIALAGAVAPAAESAAPLDLDLVPRPVSGVRVREVKATSAVVEWPAQLGGDGRFRLESRQFFLDGDKAIAMRWDEVRGAAVAREGQVFAARLSRLTPSQPYWLRVLPLNAADALGDPLFVVRFDTPAPRKVFTPLRWTLGVLGFGLAALVWLRWRAQRA